MILLIADSSWSKDTILPSSPRLRRDLRHTSLTLQALVSALGEPWSYIVRREVAEVCGTSWFAFIEFGSP